MDWEETLKNLPSKITVEFNYERRMSQFKEDIREVEKVFNKYMEELKEFDGKEPQGNDAIKTFNKLIELQYLLLRAKNTQYD